MMHIISLSIITLHITFLFKGANAFLISTQKWGIPLDKGIHRPHSIEVNVNVDDLTPEMMEARSNFFFWFFGASGAAGLARSAFPRMYQNVMEIQELAKWTPTSSSRSSKSGGSSSTSSHTDFVGLSPLCGYPRDVSTTDVLSIINNKLSAAQIVAKYPVEGNFWAAKGYLTYDAFSRANANVDPLAVRAVFDCFAQSTPLSNPDIAQSKLDSYRESLETFKRDLLYSKVTGWASILTLLGLLGLADIEAFNFANVGWFPDWPGGKLWQEGGLFDPNIGLSSIPKYWK
jgi:hypothetical protein